MAVFNLPPAKASQPGISAVAAQVGEEDEVNPGHDLQALTGRELFGKGETRRGCWMAERLGEVLREKDGCCLAIINRADRVGAEDGL